jgi:epoxyqueuosine reductase
MESLTVLVKNEAKRLGADIVGIASVDRWEKAPNKLSPTAHLPGANSVIVMGIHHPDASVEWGGLPNSNYAGPFQIGMIPKLDTMSKRLANYLESYGEKAVPYPCTGFWRHRPYKEIESTNTASFSHRHAAVAAGLGEFGLNNMFMSAKYGPRQRLVSVITTAQLTPDPLYNGQKLCDQCRMCARHCPGNNFSQENLLAPGTDKVVIYDKVYEYAKLNRWRCLWGEQFALDMDKLKDYDIKVEEDLYKAVENGISRVGGEFGSCFRYCMAKPVRYWNRKYTTAPRRKKQQQQKPTNQIISEITEIARKNGVEEIDIRPLSDFKQADMKLSEGYPVEEMKQHFSWVISMSRSIPQFTKGIDVLQDCEDYIKAVTKVRLSIAAYDIASYIDGLGYEAMQDWMSLGDTVFESKAPGKNIQHEYKPDGEVSLSRESRYKLAAVRTLGVQREQQSMTAGQQGQADKKDTNIQLITCSVICNVKLKKTKESLGTIEQEKPLEDMNALSCLRYVDKVATASVNKIGKLPGTADIKKIMPAAKTIIVLATSIPKYIAQMANRQEAECATTYSYLQYQTLRELLWAAHDLSDWLGKKGFLSLPLADITLTSFRTAAPYWEFSWAKLGHPDPRANAPLAAAVGLGEIGKSGLLLTPDYGPHQKFVFIITEAELPDTPTYNGEPLCKSCGRCAAACPVKALDSLKVETIETGNENSYSIYPRQEESCQWARSLAMVGAEGSDTIGWKKPDLPAPDKITEEYAQAALSQKDPLQVKGYLYQCQIETLVEPCAQACPAGID